MDRWRRLVVFVVLGVGVVAAPAAALDPVFNGGFGRDLRGWNKERIPVAWSDRDGDGLANSGSALVVNDGPPMSGEGLYQCLQGFAFTPGKAMALAARIHLPAGQAATGWAAVGLNWFAKPGCQEGLSVGGPRAEVSTPNGGFEWASLAFSAPDGAVSAELVVYVTRVEEGRSLLAYFDDVTVWPATTPMPRTDIYVPAAAHVFGAAGTAWRTDLVLHNPTGAVVQAYFEMLERGQANTEPRSRVYMVPPGESVMTADALTTWLDGAAAIRIRPQTGTLVVGTRTYNLTAAGTYGQFIPGIPEDEATVSGQSARLIQLAESAASGTGYRTNIGLVSAVGMPIQVRIELYTSTGALLGTKTEAVPAFAFMQFDRIFAEFTSADVANGYAIVSTPTPGGRFIAYASVIDNRTGDAICVQPSRI